MATQPSDLDRLLAVLDSVCVRIRAVSKAQRVSSRQHTRHSVLNGNKQSALSTHAAECRDGRLLTVGQEGDDDVKLVLTWGNDASKLY